MHLYLHLLLLCIYWRSSPSFIVVSKFRSDEPSIIPIRDWNTNGLCTHKLLYIKSRTHKTLAQSSHHSFCHTSHMLPTIIMSPITFKQQVEQLVSELAKCIQLCQDIRAYRKIGNRHENLDRLQSTLESAEASIPMAYNTTRRLVGSQFELGDGKPIRNLIPVGRSGLIRNRKGKSRDGPLHRRDADKDEAQAPRDRPAIQTTTQT